MIGMRERNGDVITRVVRNRKKATLEPHVFANVKPHTEIHTDELISYRDLGEFKGYWHKTVNHSANQYATATGTTVNGIEGFWAQLKRGIPHSCQREVSSEVSRGVRVSSEYARRSASDA